jgi:hypothetical protein
MTRLVLGKMPVCRRHSRPKQSLARNLLQAQGRLRNNLLEHLYPFKGHRQLGVDHRIDRERIGQTCRGFPAELRSTLSRPTAQGPTPEAGWPRLAFLAIQKALLALVNSIQ